MISSVNYRVFSSYLEMKRILKSPHNISPHSSVCWRPFWSAKSDAGRANKTYVSNRVRRSARALQDIFETSDRDIKKERATSCPAGGHWRGINHPREGLHFNARGWISNARAQRRDRERDNRRDCRCNRPARFYAARAPSWVRCSQRLSETRIPSLQMQRAPYPASRGCGTTPTTKKFVVVAEPRLAELASFSLPFPPFFFIPLWCMLPDFTAINLLAGCVQSILFSV